MLLSITLMMCSSFVSLAQDPQFSQYYAAPLYHNPAFTGSMFRHRAVANYRNQWTGLSNSFVTYSASFDTYIKDYNSGVGVLFSNDKAGAASLSSTSMSAFYAYHLKLNKTMHLNAGFQAGYVQRSASYYDLTFGSQIANDNGSNGQLDPIAQQASGSFGFFDVGTGLLLYSKNYWAGLSVQHLTKPNQSSLLNENSVLYRRVSLTGGYMFVLAREGGYKKDKVVVTSVVPTLLYKHQGPFDQLDIGLYFNHKVLTTGLWYRGLPIKVNKQGIFNHDALALMIGIRDAGFTIGYSYDINISKAVPLNGGSHEVSIIYQFGNATKRVISKCIPCPAL